MTILIIGATGTLGSQIARSALKEGYQVRCMVRNLRKARFLKKWGAKLIWGDLCKPDSILPALTGVRAIIDASTARPDDSIYQLDLKGKKFLLEAAKMMKIEQFISFSLLLNEQNLDSNRTLKNIKKDVPLITIKTLIEQSFIDSGINFTIIKLDGFFQTLIRQYAVPILDQQLVWITSQNRPIYYLDTRDIGNFVINILKTPKISKTVFPLVSNQCWDANDIIQLCECLSGQNAKIGQLPLSLLILISNFFLFFEWSWEISDRLAFSKIKNDKLLFKLSLQQIYEGWTFQTIPIVSIQSYLQEYFVRILKILKELNYQQGKKKKKVL
uniref:NmrA-like domain-containing protein n=1 Tax=Gloeochaete wittrockiana TaxID=38269 RepID=A0A3G1IW12_9EUKA|nr:hypothetical protein [Gloeochaete wittrockiana]ASQ40230.1 hypothetical protein [Gloeochaete wittrockiana]